MHNLELFNNIKPSPKTRVVNVASVPQRSPFRYPGGKTWLIPVVRKWLGFSRRPQTILVECFAGGGIVSLTAAFENLAGRVIMIELDEEVAAAWETILGEDNGWLADKIFSFELTRENVEKELANDKRSARENGFRTILKNRILHGGIIAKGSGFIKTGENGKGISSRWYPKTIRDRLLAIAAVKHKISFIRGDAFKIAESYINEQRFCFFIDPPYTVAGKRLYTHYEIDHDRLFHMASRIKGNFLMTYDDSPEIRGLAEKYSFPYVAVPMKTTHHRQKMELLISINFDWLD